MSALRRASAAALARLRGWAGSARAWWGGLDPAERVLYRALSLFAGGFALWIPPLALIVPAIVLSLVFFGFSLRRAE